MSDFLFEIGLEEVPAGKILGVINELKVNIEKELKEREIPFFSIKSYGTSRRIAFIISGLEKKGKDLVVENRGPSVKGAYKDGEATKAVLGFCKGQGIELEDIVIKEVKGNEYVFAIKEIPGVKVKEVLPEVLKKALDDLYFSKPMYWGNNDIAFIRPIRTLITLWDDEIIPFSYAGVETGRKGRGHRFLFDGEVTINSVNDYVEKMREAFVIVDMDERKKTIEEGIYDITKKIGAKFVIDSDLLEEVNFLVEYPTPFLGEFEKDYLKLPKEVIITTMVNNQKYFPVFSKDDSLLNYFIGVRCGDSRFIENVIRGNGKVLKARLEDAIFFYKEDKKVSLLSLRGKLDKVIYQEKLGSIGDKIDRIGLLSKDIASKLDYAGKDLDVAVNLSKMDLATHMVYEFTELQGIMGYYYALEEGYSKDVALSIKEHYQPVSAGDDVPHGDLGIIVALADKIDTLTSIVKAGLIPKGSQDPYGLRRIALGIIRILVENRKYVSIRELLEKSQSNVSSLADVDIEFYIDFLKVRFKSYLEKEGLRYDLIDSILALDFDDIYTLYMKAVVLKEYSLDDGFSNLINLLKRVSNIVKESKEVDYSKEDLVEEKEVVLEGEFVKVKEEFNNLYAKEDYYGCLSVLGKLEKPLDEFFDSVMVMVDDEKIRNNRISLLNSIKVLGDEIFIASKIVN